MPVTKKKGAIFAVYSDSPTKATSSAPTKSTQILSTRSAKTIGSTASRKALTSLQPSSIKSSASSSIKGKAASGDKKSSVFQDEPVKSKSSTDPVKPSITTKNAAPPPLKSAPSKRQLEVFSAPTPTTATAPSLRASPVPADLRVTSPTFKTGSPSKKTKATPAKSRPVENKENHPPAPSIADSPASRTRSKTRNQEADHTILESQPVVPRSRTRSSPPAESISVARASSPPVPGGQLPMWCLESITNGLTTFIEVRDGVEDTRQRYCFDELVATGNIAFSGRDDDKRILQFWGLVGAVGDGRGTLTFKKGRQVGTYINGREVEEGPSSRSSKEVVSTPSSSKKGKGRSVTPDGPLVDVSEAYGASGDEPEGFREASRESSL